MNFFERDMGSGCSVFHMSDIPPNCWSSHPRSSLAAWCPSVHRSLVLSAHLPKVDDLVARGVLVDELE
jgi:hypothetical protein